MLPPDPDLLRTLAHPCIGAFIGYLTNKIAIRMLFRPLRPWHLFGCRIPMTPGVIPAKRHALAVNIGAMVGRHLLTSKDIGAALSEEPFQDHLGVMVDRRVRELLSRDLGPLPTLIPDRFQPYFKVAVRTLKYRLAEGVNGHLAGEAFAQQLRLAMDARLGQLADQELNTLVSFENRQSVYLLFDELLDDLLKSEQAGLWLAGYVQEQLTRAAAQGRTVCEVLPDGVVRLIRELIRSQSGPILSRMGERISDPEIRAQMIKGILAAVDHFLEKLGPVGAMARGFLEAETLEGKIAALLEEKKEAIGDWLNNPEVQARMGAALEETIDGWLASPLSKLLDKVDEARLAEICRHGAAHLMAALRSEGSATGLRALVHIGMEEMLQGGRLRLGELGCRYFPGEDGQGLRQTLVRECLDLIRSRHSRRLIGNMLAAMVDTLLAKPLGPLDNIIPRGVREGLNDTILHATNRVLLLEVPGVVRSLNIERVVTEKVDGLDLLQLERLLLSIMEQQFKYINLFGALLGFLLGLINLALGVMSKAGG